MKRIPLIIALCFIGLSTFAQDTTKVKQHLNEFGIDVTGFLKEYLNFGVSDPALYSPSYTPTYYLTYRRHFNCGNLRVQVGGSYSNNQISSNYNSDTNRYYEKGYSINTSIGWEFYDNLGKKWQVFYGADLRGSYVYSNNDDNTSGVVTANGSLFFNGWLSKTQIYGLAPLLGIRFKLTKRLSILTETSYTFNWEYDFNGTYYVASPGATGPAPHTTSQKNTKIYSTFSQPLSIFFDFTI